MAMRESTWEAGVTGDERVRVPLADRLARRLVESRLRPLKSGRIHFRDVLGDWVAGPGADVELDARIAVFDTSFYRRVATGGTLGAAESYLRGHWDCDDLAVAFRILLRDHALLDAMDRGLGRLIMPFARLGHRMRRNTRSGSKKNIHAHYDLSNEFFTHMLDDSMTYSCGIFSSPETNLGAAQEAKLERICRKLGLGANDHVVEIGSGWGSFAIHAARRHGCRVTTTTISRAQLDYSREKIQALGLADRVRVLFQDYRDLEGEYDKLVSIEMIEAVGHENQGEFLRKCSSLLKPDGAALIQAITLSDSHYENYRKGVDFIQRHVFPGSCLLSLTRIAGEAAKAGLRIQHLDDIGPHYVGTLRAWRDRFQRRLEEVRRLGFPERFVRTWNYYLSYCEAGFLERFLGDAQVLLVKPDCRRGFEIPALPASPW
jgi:cyclopropane-fatty-acyl-phospholipid synthase